MQLCGVRLGVGDEVLKGIGRKILLRDERHGLLREQGHWGKIADGAIGQLLVNRGVKCVRADGAEQECVAVGRRLGDTLGADNTCRGADVLDDDLLVQEFAHARRKDASQDIERAAGREWHDHGQRPCRPVLRAGRRRPLQTSDERNHRKPI